MSSDPNWPIGQFNKPLIPPLVEPALKPMVGYPEGFLQKIDREAGFPHQPAFEPSAIAAAGSAGGPGVAVAFIVILLAIAGVALAALLPLYAVAQVAASAFRGFWDGGIGAVWDYVSSSTFNHPANAYAVLGALVITVTAVVFLQRWLFAALLGLVSVAAVNQWLPYFDVRISATSWEAALIVFAVAAYSVGWAFACGYVVDRLLNRKPKIPQRQLRSVLLSAAFMSGLYALGLFAFHTDFSLAGVPVARLVETAVYSLVAFILLSVWFFTVSAIDRAINGRHLALI